MKYEKPKEVQRYSHFEYYVQKRKRCFGEAWRPEARCDDAKEAQKYLDEYGKMDYRGEYHGDEMRVVEIETVCITRVLSDNEKEKS